MNFSFLFILLLLVLGFTHKTLNISKRMLLLAVIVLVILAITYNIKEKFQATIPTVTTSVIDESTTTSTQDLSAQNEVIRGNIKKYLLFAGSPVIDSLKKFVNIKSIPNDNDIILQNVKAELLKILTTK